MEFIYNIERSSNLNLDKIYMADDINKPNKISNFQLKLGYWYVSHKLQLKKLLAIFLVILCVVSYGYVIYRLFTMLIIDYQPQKKMINSLAGDNYIDYQYFHQAQGPADLQLLKSDIITGREKRYDFVAKIKNPNPNFVIKQGTLQLMNNGEVIKEKSFFVFPQEEKYVGILGQELENSDQTALRISKTSWLRYHNFEEFKASRFNFLVNDIDFVPSRELKIKGDLPVSTLNFILVNDTAYSYWQVGVWMILISGDRVAGANYLILDEFLAGESRAVEMRWYESLPAINKIEVLSEVNILDPNSYMPAQ